LAAGSDDDLKKLKAQRWRLAGGGDDAEEMLSSSRARFFPRGESWQAAEEGKVLVEASMVARRNSECGAVVRFV
jgi:hypothetical protein